jgi:hypothetical protein
MSDENNWTWPEKLYVLPTEAKTYGASIMAPRKEYIRQDAVTARIEALQAEIDTLMYHMAAVAVERKADREAAVVRALEAAAICALCQVSADPHRTAESVAMDINNAIRAIINDPARVAAIAEGRG